MKKYLCLLLLAAVFLTACSPAPPTEPTETVPTTVTTEPTVPETTQSTEPTLPPVLHTVYFWTEQKVSNIQGIGGVYTRTYDENGNLLTDNYASADGNVVTENIYTYNPAGQIMTHDTYDKRSAAGHTEFIYDSEGRLVTEVFYNSENYTAKTNYIYHEDGKLMRKVTVSGKNEDKTAYFYDENSHITKEQQTVTSGEKILQNNVVEYTYDAFGNVLTKSETRAGSLFRKEEWTYNESGNILTYQESDGAGTVGEAMKYVYKAGRLGRETFSKGGSVEDVAEYEYDEAGRVLLRYSGTPYQQFISINKIIRYTYDEFGNLLTEVTTKKDGTELSRREYTYITMELPVK